ncbi:MULTISPECIES: hypothetical protein [unclassified Nocardioides]|uniref:hypothetical protein n=1 Tax=unclassified Nocardioides TaxID=2615069 RepID=UPI000701A67A|nr:MULTISPECIES: hypothetical protein [unclassified Nocardioides]KRA32383.1 hypothetical protein ASD81_12450 [Nocardioides sp. Root614]KRA89035.1 hypothetical protein ASD84_12715 [Nocardioides sp. Root682]
MLTKCWRLLLGTRVTPPEPTETRFLHPERRDYRLGVLWTLLLGALLALNETNGLARGFVAGGEAAMDFGALSGLRFESVWDFWALPMAAEDLTAWNRLLRFFIVLDFGFIAVYTLLLRRIVRAGFVPAGWRGLLDGAVVALCTFDVLENVVMVIAGNQRVNEGPAGGYEPWPLLWLLTALKWSALAVVLGSFVIMLISKDRGEVVKPWRTALWVQRYSLFAFLPVAALACLPVPKVGDQVPDIERRWLDGHETSHLVWAVVATLVVIAPAIFFLGRLRADCAFKRSCDEATDGRGWPWYYPKGEPREAHLWHWLIAPAIVSALFGLAKIRDWPTDGKRLVVFCLITVSVPVASCVVRWHFQKRAKKTHYKGPAARQETATTDPEHVMAVGDALAIAAVAAVGLGMMRAWIGLLAVGVSTEDIDVPWQLWLATPLAVAAAVVPWFLAGPVLKRLDIAEPATGKESQLAVWATPTAPLYEDQDTGRTRVTGDNSQWIRVLLLAGSGGAFGWMAFNPIGWASALGVVASVTLALGAAMMLLGVVVAYSQESRPPEILLVVPRPWLTATPIVPFIVIGLVTTALIGSPTFVHGIDQDKQEYRAVPPRPTLAEAFTTWADNPSPCVAPDAITVTIDGKEKAFDARPMLILAAEGGGIRATYWTAQGLEEVADAGGTCGQKMTLFSTGASGGSLGLTVGRYDDEPLATIDAIRGPDSLGAGAVALVTGDLLASTTGIRIGAPAADTDPDGTDRAATMQEVWVEAWDEAGTGDGPADHRFIEEDDSALDTVTGHLVLTSTDSYDGCRALWSQIDLSPPEMSAAPSMTETSNAPGCGTGGAGPNSYDVLGSFGATEATTLDADDHCVGNVSALTAGLVSGRFPYVTPSAVVGPCGELTETPLVDGGITDNTGLGTVIDLASQWGPLVRAHNDEVLAAGTGSLILPMVVYLDNGPATSFGIDQRGGSIAESLIPLWAISAAATRQAPTSALLRQGADAAERFLCSEPSVVAPVADPTPCQQLLQQQTPEPQVFVVHQATQPTLSAPLGWVLSDASVEDLVSDMAEARSTGCPTDASASTEPADPVCVDGHGTLFDLRKRLESFREE